jgi:hypothetical protein
VSAIFDSVQGAIAYSCEYGDEIVGYVMCWEFLEWLRNCWLL